MTGQVAHCAVPGCRRPAVATVSASSVRISFRTDHAQMPAWSEWLRCWPCAGAELDQHIASATPVTPCATSNEVVRGTESDLRPVRT